MQEQVTKTRERLDFIWLELTGRCNLECIHCYADSGPERPLSEGMELEDWLGALDDAASLGCRKVQYIGGEPTLYPGLPRLIEYARRIGYEQQCVYTNGTHLTDELKAVFKTHDVSLAFSVYGPTGDVHDRVTMRNGSFMKTYHGIRWAVDSGLSVRTSIIEMEVNFHDVELTKQLLRGAGVSAVHVDRIRGVGRGTQGCPPESQLKELCGRCGNGKVCVSYSGDVYPCVFSRFWPLGNIKVDGLGAVTGGPRLQQFYEAAIAAADGMDESGGTKTSRLPGGSAFRQLWANTCSPEEPAPPCSPERDPGPCNPEIDPGPCTPEKPSSSPYVNRGASLL